MEHVRTIWNGVHDRKLIVWEDLWINNSRNMEKGNKWKNDIVSHGNNFSEEC